MSQNWNWKETGPSKDKKLSCSDNPGQKFWTKMV